jgi:hypothetical protein
MTHCNIRLRFTANVLLFLAFILIAGVSTAAADHGGTPSTRGVQPFVVSGNPSCADVAPGTIELKIQPVVPGSHSDGTLEFTIISVFDSRFFDWASNIGVDVVVVKGGPNANIYSYAPEATRDGSLHAPINHQNNKPYGLSHVSACYDQDAPPPPPPPPPAGQCTGQAFDIRLDLAGTPASGFLGPAIKTDPDVFPDREQFSHVSLGLPGTPGPVVTADTLVAENSGTPELGCTTQVYYENLGINLNNLPGGGVPLTLSAAVLRTTATAGAGRPPSTEVQIVNLSVNGQQVGNLSPAPNTVLLDLSTLGLPDVTGSIVLHEQSPIPGGMSANAIRVQVFVVNLLTGINQAIDLKVAHAEADVH